MANFSFVGCLRPMKKDGYDEKTYESGWVRNHLKFLVVSGNNSHIVEITGGKWADDSKNVIYTMSRAAAGAKSEKMEIAWEDRHKQEVIDTVAGFRIYTCDLDTFAHRKEIKENGTPEEIAASEKRRKEFLSEYEFCEFMNKVVNNEKLREAKFRINGNIEYTYSAEKNTYYSNLKVNKVYMVDPSTEFSNQITMDYFFEKDCIDDQDFADIGKAMVTGYTPFYCNNPKGTFFAPVNLIIRGDEKFLRGMHKIFSETNAEVRKTNLNCEYINGAEMVTITEDDLTEDEKENIDLGITTFEDIVKDRGGVVGDRITEIRVTGLGRGFTGKLAEDTVYTADDVKKKPVVAQSPTDTSESKKESVVEDFFDDDDLFGID